MKIYIVGKDVTVWNGKELLDGTSVTNAILGLKVFDSFEKAKAYIREYVAEANDENYEVTDESKFSVTYTSVRSVTEKETHYVVTVKEID